MLAPAIIQQHRDRPLGIRAVRLDPRGDQDYRERVILSLRGGHSPTWQSHLVRTKTNRHTVPESFGMA
ncbi:MAG: hypothetical protein ABIG43_00365 [Chloroflexota bacterium]